jgi:YggT family protein
MPGRLFLSLAFVLDKLLTLYLWVVIISALLSWVNPDPYNPIVRFLRGATEPVFARVRRWLPFAVLGGFDLSPVVVIFVIYFLQLFAVGTLEDLARSVQGVRP